jgi:hypothetical protein
MRTFSSGTDATRIEDLPASARAHFSATGARLHEKIWLRVETRWIANGTAFKVTIYRRTDDDDPETVKEIDATLDGGEWEQEWPVELEQDVLDEVHGPIHLWFEAEIDGLPLPARSQTLLVHRTRFSS